jgi:fatty acid desaturase
MAVAFGCYGLWGLSLALASGILGDWPNWVWIPIAVVAVAWHASLQHEVIHGHPTSSRLLNRLIAGPPLLLWLRFASYRASHLAHHRDEVLTDPIEDPESFYVTDVVWHAVGPIGRGFLTALNTLLGRLVLGPGFVILRSLKGEARSLLTTKCDDRLSQLGAVAVFLLQVGAVLSVLVASGVPIQLYVFGVVWPATSLMLLRSFVEHRPAHNSSERTAIVEDTGVFGLLFLSNNLHALHHEQPQLPWYRLASFYRVNKCDILAHNGFYWFPGYISVIRAFALKAKDSLRHPHA